MQLFFFNRSEARRTQPVAVLNRDRSRDLNSRFGVSLTNHGSGTAFNVRAGIILDGVEYPLGQGDGNRYTVAPGERVPPNGMFELEVGAAPYGLARGGPDVDDRAVFHARYENAYGKTYETLNPANPLASFKVRRARLARFRRYYAWRQRRKRETTERIFNRRFVEEMRSAETGRPIRWRRRVMRRVGR
ncbi:MAG: hypothetical protein ABI717_05655 [Actinomycetota bacterium]